MTEYPNSFTNDELRERLSSLQYHVTQESGTEQAFTGDTWDQKDTGTYLCVVCDTALFSSENKYESGSGWPSFWQPLSDTAVDTQIDNSHGMVRVEALCHSCGAHLGHIFPDGPQPTGDRYCMNSASMRFNAENSSE
ncbi:MAG TPA: peptide-methionine (R)-S-oxide reductase MsrB [Acidimicrobiales bacterium]|jgi:peptide-methionine (R)-S-oxide reductase|nr:peptide-methionine (R)-S-oxide reductase MsrB [Acidimicrobiales bacterium]|tara:strand:+ start:6680 stop:7090 length:411 start_codon:yes stop_codon:yes gene_type:complete